MDYFTKQYMTGPEGAHRRAVYKAMGFTDADLSRPLVAVVNSWGEVCPGHFGLNMLTQKVKEGIWQSGATPVEFCTISQCGTLTLGLDGIRYDLATREMVSFDIETIVLPCEKDDTDTVFAVKEALKRGFDDFLLIGVVGARLDHTLGNVSILLYLDSLGKKGIIIDDYSEMEIISNKPAYIEDSYAFFSLLNVTGTAKGITIENAKYPLENAEITCEYQYGISNEVLPGRRAKVTVLEGKLLLIKDRG